MSSGWSAYIQTLTDSSSEIRRAAIIGLNDGSVWARTEGENEFKATESELKKFVVQFDELDKVPTTGSDLEGVHYIVPRTEENLIFGKKEKTGFFAAKTKTAVLVAIYEGEAVAGSEVRSAVDKLAKYLEGVGY